MLDRTSTACASAIYPTHNSSRAAVEQNARLQVQNRPVLHHRVGRRVGRRPHSEGDVEERRNRSTESGGGMNSLHQHPQPPWQQAWLSGRRSRTRGHDGGVHGVRRRSPVAAVKREHILLSCGIEFARDRNAVAKSRANSPPRQT